MPTGTIWLVTVVLLGAGGDPDEIQGTWRLVSVERDGLPPEAVAGEARLAIGPDGVRYGGELIARTTADPSATPKTLDLEMISPGRSFEGIYTVEGEAMRFCLNRRTDGVKERPSAFATAGRPDLRTLTFRKVPAVVGDPREGLRGFVGLILRFDEIKKGLFVEGALEGSPAGSAGLVKDDLILAIDGTSPADLRTAVETFRRARPGSEIGLRVSRDGVESVRRVRVGVLPFAVVAELD